MLVLSSCCSIFNDRFFAPLIAEPDYYITTVSLCQDLFESFLKFFKFLFLFHFSTPRPRRDSPIILHSLEFVKRFFEKNEIFLTKLDYGVKPFAGGACGRGEVAFLKKSSAKNFCRGAPNKGHPKANREATRVRSQKKLEGGAATKVFAELFSKSDLPRPQAPPRSIKIQCTMPNANSGQKRAVWVKQPFYIIAVTYSP